MFKKLQINKRFTEFRRKSTPKVQDKRYPKSLFYCHIVRIS